jgi:uncharacterized iron-regulated membrane protein
MISARFAQRIASLHKWLGLIVGAQLLVWTATGLFFAVFPIEQIRGDHLVRPAVSQMIDLSRLNLSLNDALASVAEDAPERVTLRSLAGEPVYEIRAPIGVFVVSGENGALVSPIEEETARAIALDAWVGAGELKALRLVDAAPRESGLNGPVWIAGFDGAGNRSLYISAVTGELGPVRTDLWRTYDVLWSLHIMDYETRENFNHPLIIAAAILALSVVLFGIVLLVHRFTRGLLRRPT